MSFWHFFLKRRLVSQLLVSVGIAGRAVCCGRLLSQISVCTSLLENQVFLGPRCENGDLVKLSTPVCFNPLSGELSFNQLYAARTAISFIHSFILLDSLDMAQDMDIGSLWSGGATSCG